MSNSVLTGDELTNAMSGLDGWAVSDDEKAISKTFNFTDFKSAFSFMTHAAMYAETDDHHPEWFNVYNRVDVKLTTHDAGGITELDMKLATAMDSAAS